MENYKLCESDYKFMTLIWENEPISSTSLVHLCEKTFNWKKSTTFTMIKKLSEKGYAKNENATVTSLIKRELVEKYESERIINDTFKGSLPSFLTAFFGGKKISEKEAEELKKLIDEYKE
ncbi:MAG: BlaI/MecI/CopY family transcriptional regulator [Clostridia bacterium]|nr:BlaI/MecI/CopY family transcriptional regulator [Clostridia bacterium]